MSLADMFLCLIVTRLHFWYVKHRVSVYCSSSEILQIIVQENDISDDITQLHICLSASGPGPGP